MEGGGQSSESHISSPSHEEYTPHQQQSMNIECVEFELAMLLLSESVEINEGHHQEALWH
jgi:hypothetical protein